MNTHTMSINRRSAFTIVELTIVIAVIAILASIVFVSYTGITASSNANKARSLATDAAKTMEQFNADRSTYPTTLSQIAAYGTQQGDASKFASGTTFLKGPANPSNSIDGIGFSSAQLALVANASGVEPLSTTNGMTKIAYSYTLDATTGVANGGVIIYWDYKLKAVAAVGDYIYVGSASSTSTFIAPGS